MFKGGNALGGDMKTSAVNKNTKVMNKDEFKKWMGDKVHYDTGYTGSNYLQRCRRVLGDVWFQGIAVEKKYKFARAFKGHLHESTVTRSGRSYKRGWWVLPRWKVGYNKMNHYYYVTKLGSRYGN